MFRSISSDKAKEMEEATYLENSEAEGRKKWVISGIPLQNPLKPIFTKQQAESAVVVPDHHHQKKKKKKKPQYDQQGSEEEEEGSRTPTGEESRIPTIFPCPPAPRKRKPSRSWCQYYNGVREFFCPCPDLESVFKRRVEKA